MKSNDFVIINNRAYDAVTGLPVETPSDSMPNSLNSQPAVDQANQPAPAVNRRGLTTPNIHRTVQRSETLSRRYVKKPQATATSQPAQQAAPQFSAINVRHVTTAKSPAINKFTTASKPVRLNAQTFDRPAQTHPVMRRASVRRSLDISPVRQKVENQQRIEQRAMPAQQLTVAQKTPVHHAPTSQTHTPAKIIKEQAIEKALNNQIDIKKEQKLANKRNRSKLGWGRAFSIASASLAIVMLAGYLTYLSMPNLSVKMAAVQSGVNAKYPSYRPDGYALNGPISFKEGEVAMNFAYAGDDRGFTLKQKSSNWDSTAVQEFVDSKTDSPTITAVDGLKIYSYDNNAVWVNAGVLYTVEGDAPLSGSQIQKIATSM